MENLIEVKLKDGSKMLVEKGQSKVTGVQIVELARKKAKENNNAYPSAKLRFDKAEKMFNNLYCKIMDLIRENELTEAMRFESKNEIVNTQIKQRLEIKHLSERRDKLKSEMKLLTEKSFSSNLLYEMVEELKDTESQLVLLKMNKFTEDERSLLIAHNIMIANRRKVGLERRDTIKELLHSLGYELRDMGFTKKSLNANIVINEENNGIFKNLDRNTLNKLNISISPLIESFSTYVNLSEENKREVIAEHIRKIEKWQSVSTQLNMVNTDLLESIFSEAGWKVHKVYGVDWTMDFS